MDINERREAVFITNARWNNLGLITVDPTTPQIRANANRLGLSVCLYEPNTTSATEEVRIGIVRSDGDVDPIATLTQGHPMAYLSRDRYGDALAGELTLISTAAGMTVGAGELTYVG